MLEVLEMLVLAAVVLDFNETERRCGRWERGERGRGHVPGCLERGTPEGDE